jgi:hypothetical protein
LQYTLPRGPWPGAVQETEQEDPRRPGPSTQGMEQRSEKNSTGEDRSNYSFHGDPPCIICGWGGFLFPKSGDPWPPRFILYH